MTFHHTAICEGTAALLASDPELGRPCPPMTLGGESSGPYSERRSTQAERPSGGDGHSLTTHQLLL